jgi:hypothetical protein
LLLITFINPNQNIDDTQQIIKKTTPVEATLPLPPGFETGPIKENISDAIQSPVQEFKKPINANTSTHHIL